MADRHIPVPPMHAPPQHMAQGGPGQGMSPQQRMQQQQQQQQQFRQQQPQQFAPQQQQQRVQTPIELHQQQLPQQLRQVYPGMQHSGVQQPGVTIINDAAKVRDLGAKEKPEATTEKDIRKQLTTYEAHSITPVSDDDNKKENKKQTGSRPGFGNSKDKTVKKERWGKILQTQEALSQKEMATSIKKLDERESVDKKMEDFGKNQRQQVTELIAEKRGNEYEGQWFEWDIAQLKRNYVKDSKGKKLTKSITFYLRRSPKADVDCREILHSRNMAKQIGLQRQHQRANFEMEQERMAQQAHLSQMQEQQRREQAAMAQQMPVQVLAGGQRPIEGPGMQGRGFPGGQRPIGGPGMQGRGVPGGPRPIGGPGMQGRGVPPPVRQGPRRVLDSDESSSGSSDSDSASESDDSLESDITSPTTSSGAERRSKKYQKVTARSKSRSKSRSRSHQRGGRDEDYILVEKPGRMGRRPFVPDSPRDASGRRRSASRTCRPIAKLSPMQSQDQFFGLSNLHQQQLRGPILHHGESADINHFDQKAAFAAVAEAAATATANALALTRQPPSRSQAPGRPPVSRHVSYHIHPNDNVHRQADEAEAYQRRDEDPYRREYMALGRGGVRYERSAPRFSYVPRRAHIETFDADYYHDAPGSPTSSEASFRSMQLPLRRREPYTERSRGRDEYDSHVPVDFVHRPYRDELRDIVRDDNPFAPRARPRALSRARTYGH